MEEEFVTCRQKRLVSLASLPRRERPQFNILPFLTLLILPQCPKQECQVLLAIHERFAMIRERKGYYPAAFTQSFTRQNTIPFFNSSPDEAVVKTVGS